jgi:hypothetical protein
MRPPAVQGQQQRPLVLPDRGTPVAADLRRVAQQVQRAELAGRVGQIVKDVQGRPAQRPRLVDPA